MKNIRRILSLSIFILCESGVSAEESWHKARLLSLSKGFGPDSPACPYVDGGVRFKDTNMLHCFARCLDLVDEKPQGKVKCSYTPDTMRIVGDNCSGIFKPNHRTEKRVFCNFDAIWSLKEENSNMSEKNTSKWITENSFCTHILIYPLVKYYESSKMTVLMDDEYQKFLPHIREFHKARMKVLATIGTWYELKPMTISPKLFSTIAKNDEQRENFVKDVVKMFMTHELDGVNIRWVYPASPLPSGDGPVSDKQNYVALIKSFSSLLRPLGLMLTAEGTINKAIISKGIDIAKFAPYLDNYLVYATDVHGTWLVTTGQSTPNKEVRSAMEYVTLLMVDPSKLILGFRLGCAVFELIRRNPKSTTGVFANIDKKSEIAWFKLMKKMFLTEKDKWHITRGTAEGQSYACDGEKWVSFDDMVTIKARMDIVKSLGLGGVHFFSVFDDDLHNELGCGKSPFVRTVNEILRGYGECVLPSCP